MMLLHVGKGRSAEPAIGLPTSIGKELIVLDKLLPYFTNVIATSSVAPARAKKMT